jgi:hypothetical protein
MSDVITLKKISQLLNISISTASRALKDHPDIADATKQKLKYYGLKTHRLNRGLKVHLVASPFFNFVYYASFKKVCRS